MEDLPDLSKMQIKSDSPTSPGEEERQEERSTRGKCKKSNTKKTKKIKSSPIEASSSAELTHASSVPINKNVASGEEPAPSTSQVAEGKKRKEDEEEEECGLGLGTSKSQRRKKKKSSKAEAEKPKPESSIKPSERVQQLEEPNLRPVHAPQAWLRPQRKEFVPQSPPTLSLGQPSVATSSRVMSSQSWQGPFQSQRIEPQWPHLSMRPELEDPTPEPWLEAGPSNLQRNREQCSKHATEHLKPTLKLNPKKKQSVSENAQSTCLFKIPNRFFGRSVHYKTIQLCVNYIHMEIQPIKIYRYDVSFQPEKPKKFLPLACRQVLNKYFNKIPIGFDQCKNVYSYKYLPGVPLEQRKTYNTIVKDAEDSEFRFEVSFKFTGVVDLTTIFRYMKDGTSLHPPTEAIQAIDVILRQGTLESYVKVGRQFFKRPNTVVNLGEGQELWNGLFQSAIFTNRPYINIDVVHKGFPKHQLLLETFTRDFRLDASRDINEQIGRSREAFLHFLKNLKVVAYVGGDTQQGQKREFVCNGLVEPPTKKTFKLGGSVMTVAYYFETVKGCRVRYPNLNCVWVGSRNKSIYYPMEFLVVANAQVTNKQLTEAQISKIVKTAATVPSERKKKIEEVISDMNYSRNIYFKKFGLEIGNEFVSVPAKILEPPRIDVGGAAVETKNGVWSAQKVLKPQTLAKWGFITVETKYTHFDQFINMMLEVGSNMGLQINAPIIKEFDLDINEAFQYLQRARDRNLSIMVVVITSRGRDHYSRVKSAAERDIGVLTQCLMEHTVMHKKSDPMVRNLILKINAKLMGINHALESRSVPMCLQNDKVMIVGADVTHPSADQNSMPSIAAVTASMDNRYCLYNIAMSVQTSKKEMILDFENLILELLTEYEKRQRVLPNKIFVFRDGVSDGQFTQVMNSELQAVHNAYARKTGPNGKRVEVLFLLVQKRHHTRLFLGDSSYNVHSGTVVDSKIVHPRELDFFLMSHNAPRGTARPTRYHVICNDARLSQDEVEQLVYYMCHLYARCQQAVSYPTPTYYAHLACMRARSLIYGNYHLFSTEELQKNPKRLNVSENVLWQSTMFFV